MTNFTAAPPESLTSETTAARESHAGDAPQADTTRELGVWLAALDSFFNARNHPLADMERAEILTRDFTNETRIAQAALLRCLQLVAGLTRQSDSNIYDALGDDAQMLFAEDANTRPVYQGDEWDELAESLGDASALCSALLVSRIVSFQAWASLGKVLRREIRRSPAVARLMRQEAQDGSHILAPELLGVVARVEPEPLAADILEIFTRLTRLLEVLRFIEAALRSDQPLKQMLLVFTLVREETRALLDFVDGRALRIEDLDPNVFDALDGTAYAIGMELRKTFEHELVGLAGLRQATHIFAKVENAHGLLRDSFQQSIVSLAQIFDPTLEGRRLFRAFQTKLEQSLALRADIWTLLQMVRRAETEREQRSAAPLIERLGAFREGSLRFLMYKDWESYERFVEEITAARGATELAPVLHRFNAYLETLFSQINMRAVLADHPFAFPSTDE
ncbi:MAG TPA: hypothetical protein VGV59_10580 [Pyrinomonadaceae bacterium]|nr:hypothetical protein [Pyrinomonadaceae bacterium]